MKEKKIAGLAWRLIEIFSSNNKIRLIRRTHDFLRNKNKSTLIVERFIR
jgi:hypothetical protein